MPSQPSVIPRTDARVMLATAARLIGDAAALLLHCQQGPQRAAIERSRARLAGEAEALLRTRAVLAAPREEGRIDHAAARAEP